MMISRSRFDSESIQLFSTPVAAKKKRGMEMPMAFIVVAVIALLILVVMIIIFSGTANKFWKGSTECYKGVTLSNSVCGPGTTHYALGDKGDQYCCVPDDKILG